MLFSDATVDTELGKSMSNAQLQRSLGEGWEGSFTSSSFSMKKYGLKILDNGLSFNIRMSRFGLQTIDVNPTDLTRAPVCDFPPFLGGDSYFWLPSSRLAQPYMGD